MIDENTDFLCGDDLDPFMREVNPLQALEQDLNWMLIEEVGTHIASPEWGLGLESGLSKPLEQGLAKRIENRFEADDRVLEARCEIVQIDTFGESHDIRIRVQALEGFLLVEYQTSKINTVSAPDPGA